jgi:methionyl-tRNA synthetase
LQNSDAATPPGLFADIDLQQVVRDVSSGIKRCEYNNALWVIWHGLLDPANRYIDRMKPFELAKTDRAACLNVLSNLAETLRVAAILTKPFIPAASAKIYAAFSYPKPYVSVCFDDASSVTVPAELRVTSVLMGGKVPPLFPRIEASA